MAHTTFFLLGEGVVSFPGPFIPRIKLGRRLGTTLLGMRWDTVGWFG